VHCLCKKMASRPQQLQQPGCARHLKKALKKVKTTEHLWKVIEDNGPSPLFSKQILQNILQKKAHRAEIIFAHCENDRFQMFAKHLSAVAPSRSIVKRIAAFAGETPILEVGAGTGLWAKLISSEGTAVTASDISPPPENSLFHKVQKLSCDEALEAYDKTMHQDCMLLIVSPCIEFPKNFKGSKYVVIGGNDPEKLVQSKQYLDTLTYGIPGADDPYKLVDQVLFNGWFGQEYACRMYTREIKED
jgi:hypothetical protein